MGFLCIKCDPPIELDTEGGWKRHHTRMHGPYNETEMREAGITPTQRDIARSVDSGHTSIDSVIADAPESETDVKDKDAKVTARRVTKEAREQAAELAEFRRLRPQLVNRWKRRLRIPYSLWARLADDPKIALTEEELEEGAELHVDFCEAMGWLRAGKVEAIIDLVMWHGGTALGRSDLGQQLLNSFKTAPENPPDKVN